MLVAWDPIAQKERWRTPGGGGIGGGTVTTAGNLVFQVTPDGHLLAYTADKGQKLLDVNTRLRGGMGPPITFMLDGKQYVALAGGTGSLFGNRGAGPGPAPAPAAGAGRGGAATPDSPDVANAQAAQQRGAAPAAGAPPAGAPAFPPASTPKLLVFVLDGNAALPGQPQ
jgi:hypothetical protein